MSDPSPAAKRARVGTGNAAAAPPSIPGDVVVDVETPIRSGRVEAAIRSGAGGGGWKKIGSISAWLVTRNVRFHQKCDEISSDLQSIGCVMFEPDGAPRCGELMIDADPAHGSGGAKRKKRKGAFLYVEELDLTDDDPETRSDAGARAIAGLLDHPQLAGRWTVAAYVGDPRTTPTPDERAAMTGRGGGGAGADIDDEGLERQTAMHRGISLDVRKFVRCGFRELGRETISNVGCMFTTAEDWERWKRRPAEMTHAGAMRVALRADAPLDRDRLHRSARDDKLQRYLVEKGQYLPTGMAAGGRIGVLAGGGGGGDAAMWAQALGMTGQTRTGVTVASIMEGADRLVAAGADYNRCNALQACAANGLTALFCPLVNRGALVNGRDRNECTPLMIAAMSAPERTSKHDPTPPSDEVRALLALGADKDMTDDAGRTALGNFYKAMRDVNDFQMCFGIENHLGADPVLERLLMPSGGATAADKRCKGK